VDPSWRLVATSTGKTERGANTNLEPSAEREELYKTLYNIEKTVFRFVLNELRLLPAAAIRDQSFPFYALLKYQAYCFFCCFIFPNHSYGFLLL
jgi:hypothetical protein